MDCRQCCHIEKIFRIKQKLTGWGNKNFRGYQPGVELPHGVNDTRPRHIHPHRHQNFPNDLIKLKLKSCQRGMIFPAKTWASRRAPFVEPRDRKNARIYNRVVYLCMCESWVRFFGTFFFLFCAILNASKDKALIDRGEQPKIGSILVFKDPADHFVCTSHDLVVLN